jgi:hypothetical protein
MYGDALATEQGSSTVAELLACPPHFSVQGFGETNGRFLASERESYSFLGRQNANPIADCTLPPISVHNVAFPHF